VLLQHRCSQGLSQALTTALLLLVLLGLGLHDTARDSPKGSIDEARTASSGAQPSPSRRFWIWKDMFLKDGRPFRILSGSIHYHRWAQQACSQQLHAQLPDEAVVNAQACADHHHADPQQPACMATANHAVRTQSQQRMHDGPIVRASHGSSILPQPGHGTVPYNTQPDTCRSAQHLHQAATVSASMQHLQPDVISSAARRDQWCSQT
jgi:hypothetical protein